WSLRILYPLAFIGNTVFPKPPRLATGPSHVGEHITHGMTTMLLKTRRGQVATCIPTEAHHPNNDRGAKSKWHREDHLERWRRAGLSRLWWHTWSTWLTTLSPPPNKPTSNPHD